MKKEILSLLSFATGITIGFFVANRMLKERYEQRAREDIASVKEAFLNELNRYKEEHSNKDDKPVEDIQDKFERDIQSEEFKAYCAKLKKLGYAYAKDTGSTSKNGPMVISPDNFGSKEGYDEINLTYYADGTLTDDTDRIMDEADIENTVGRESLKLFGEYEDDAVHVRNDRLKADYEILKDPRSYGEVLREKPYLR